MDEIGLMIMDEIGLMMMMFFIGFLVGFRLCAHWGRQHLERMREIWTRQ